MRMLPKRHVSGAGGEQQPHGKAPRPGPSAEVWAANATPQGAQGPTCSSGGPGSRLWKERGLKG